MSDLFRRYVNNSLLDMGLTKDYRGLELWESYKDCHLELNTYENVELNIDINKIKTIGQWEDIITYQETKLAFYSNNNVDDFQNLECLVSFDVVDKEFNEKYN